MKPITPAEVKEKRKEASDDIKNSIMEYMNQWLVYNGFEFTFLTVSYLELNEEDSIFNEEEFLEIVEEVIDDYKNVGWKVDETEERWKFTFSSPGRELVVK